ncbi:MAG: diiron oxygenase [Gammaproteobacteria bacterium]|nr:diiron oxygenase [Gammaproteobacteria bacterium]
MLTHTYSYQDCLDNSQKVSWKEDEILAGRQFDFSKRFLPNKLCGVDDIECLNEAERRTLNQIMGNAYCHIFAFVEEFIIPTITEAALQDAYGDEVRFRALLRFAEEELKHQELFRRSIDLFNQGFGATCGLLPDREAVAQAVRSKSQLAVLCLTTVIEWFTQLHYREHVRDHSGLDELFRDLLKFHWMEEAQHAKLDTLLIDEIAERATPAERETAIDEVIELGGAIDGLLAQQIELNIAALEQATERRFTKAEKEEITTHTQRAWRWTFLVSGLEHPNFVKLVGELTNEGQGKIRDVVDTLSAS